MQAVLLFTLLILLFILGMGCLRAGLYNAAARSLKTWLGKCTGTPLKGMLIGTMVTAILQSSSAVMVLTVGLIAAGILTFRQSVGIILGTNIGTTFTAEFITFKIDSMVIPLALIGAILILLQSTKIRSAGFLLLGLSFIFTAMNGFTYIASPLSDHSSIGETIRRLNDSSLFSVFSGTVFTAIIQSSTAATGIIMGFLDGGILNMSAAISFMLGANIGTCITALLASIGSGKESRLCAYAHIWLNVIGVLLFFPFVNLLADLAPYLSERPEVQLAHISVIFNVVISLFVLPFSNHFSSFIERIHGKLLIN